MNNYEILQAVGQGQFGTAYKCRHKGDNQMYCVKKIPMSAKEDQKGAIKEATLLASLDHPNVLGYKESFIDSEEALCIITHFCDEGDLFGKIRKRAAENTLFSEDEIMDLFIQIASALMYIHGKKVLHRDLKTQNIFMSRGNIAKLGDFGISKVLEKTDSFATTVTGTPYYMAPEICTNQPYTFKSDIWSLGCVLYELCTLKHAFAADSLLSLVYQIVRGNFPPIPPDQFSAGMNDLVSRLLVRDTNERPSLLQVFQLPYVQHHIQRYHREERGRVLQTTSNLAIKASTMTRRQNQLQAAIRAAKESGAADDEEGLSAKERVMRKKEAERKRRALELEQAALEKQREQAATGGRKGAQVPASNAPVTANGAARPVSYGNDEKPINPRPVRYGNDEMPINPRPVSYGNDEKPISASASRNGVINGNGDGRANGYPQSPQFSGQSGSDAFNNSSVNLDTMPRQAGGFPAGGTAAGGTGAASSRPNDMYNNSAVNFGTMPGQPGGFPAGGTTGGGGRPNGDEYNNSLVNFGTMPGQPNGFPGSPTANAGGGLRASMQGTRGIRPAGGGTSWDDNVLMGSVQQAGPLGGTGAFGNTMQAGQRPQSAAPPLAAQSLLKSQRAVAMAANQPPPFYKQQQQQQMPQQQQPQMPYPQSPPQPYQQQQHMPYQQQGQVSYQQQQQQPPQQPYQQPPQLSYQQAPRPVALEGTMGSTVNYGTMNLGNGASGGFHNPNVRQSASFTAGSSPQQQNQQGRPMPGSPMASARSMPMAASGASFQSDQPRLGNTLGSTLGGTLGGTLGAAGLRTLKLPAFPTTSSASSRSSSMSPLAAGMNGSPAASATMLGGYGGSQSRSGPSTPQQSAQSPRVYSELDSAALEHDIHEDQEEVTQRQKILQNMKAMENTFGRGNGPDPEAAASGVAERIPIITKSSKAKQLELQCQAALGPYFTDVYNYLRTARSDSSGAQDEKEVQRRLLELVRGDRTKLQGCYKTDQLVFQEMMYGLR